MNWIKQHPTAFIFFLLAGILAFLLLKAEHITYVREAEATYVPDAIDGIIEQLAFCESSHREHVVNEFDNGSPSYGYLQFKEQSFLYFAEKYHVFPHAEKAEVINMLLWRSAQEKVARAIIEMEPSPLLHWRNCAEKLSLI